MARTPSSSAHVTPSSALRNSRAGSVPHSSVPGTSGSGPMVRAAGAVMPSATGVQLAPPSALRYSPSP